MKWNIYVLLLILLVACKNNPSPKGTTVLEENEALANIDTVLSGWNESTARTKIMQFIDAVTDPNDPNYVKPADRIAVFDNDGTLWSEHPFYFQGYFALDRIKSLAPQNPNWQNEQPFKGILTGDMAAVQAAGEKGIVEVMMASHAGMTTDQFEQIVTQWIDTAKHPTKQVPYTQLTFKPMKELVKYLQQHQFKCYIVSGGGIDFMRPWTYKTYGIPKSNVVGSSLKLVFEMRNDTPVLIRQAAVDFIDDGPGKPVGIAKFIGKKPIAAFGNSDGDLQMLQYTTVGEPGLRLGVIIHHTDAEREWAYDRNTAVGKLDKALDEAPKRGWVVVDMKNDWKTIY
ncbi:haloacid dehalogenase-like hydrolase [Chitinophaga skermanii]|uniref:phosphoserine phosphatase n=1 Tax=Chitinophaga skermanii TaxID=331697 RepID=A0A327QY36_9BACT|nr:HAD family hydrolase [Chitinophaga skermanii]RAJ06587.1 haloacid dehalogenase-like hydrolase [Chitinophaga skermanii]